jgi:hypothetical protein
VSCYFLKVAGDSAFEFSEPDPLQFLIKTTPTYHQVVQLTEFDSTSFSNLRCITKPNAQGDVFFADTNRLLRRSAAGVVTLFYSGVTALKCVTTANRLFFISSDAPSIIQSLSTAAETGEDLKTLELTSRIMVTPLANIILGSLAVDSKGQLSA